MSTEINHVKNIVVGEYGIPIILQLVDDSGNPVDISSYTGAKTVAARGPNAIGTPLSFTASFVNSGTDGKVQFTPTSSNNFTFEGDWEAQVKLLKTDTVALTIPFIISVSKAVA